MAAVLIVAATMPTRAQAGNDPWEEDGNVSQHRGSAFVPMDSWIYPAFDRLQALGYAPSGIAGLRPWTRAECARLLAEAADLLDAGDAAESVQARQIVLEGRKLEEILRHFMGDLTPDEISQYGARKDELYQALACEVPTMPGFLDFLSAVETRGISKAIATSANAVRTRRTLDRLGLEGRFAAVVTGSDVVAGKPDPAIYKLAAERLEKPPETVVAFEDSTSGVTAAKRAGMPCVAVCPASRVPQLLGAGADVWVPSFVDLSLDQLERQLGKRIAA